MLETHYIWNGVKIYRPFLRDDGWQFGCRLESLPYYVDRRGALTVLTPGVMDFPYSYISSTYKGQARDVDRWHKHLRQTDRFTILGGCALFGLSDGKTTFRLEIDALYRYRLTIPPGVLHCIRNIGSGDMSLINFPSHVYDPDDELRIPFGDVEAEWPWPVKQF